MISDRDRGDYDFLMTLQRLQPATVQELCEAIGVTATAVRQRLMRLKSQGLVTRQESRQERGRPRHDYSLTDHGLRWLGADHAEIAAILWRGIVQIEDADVREQVLTAIRDSLVRHLGPGLGEDELQQRLQQLCESLSERGFDVEVAAQDPERSLPILRENSCPYHELVSEDPSFCELEQSVFSTVLGVPVELSACRRDGHHCCEFQVGPTSAVEERDAVASR